MAVLLLLATACIAQPSASGTDSAANAHHAKKAKKAAKRAEQKAASAEDVNQLKVTVQEQQAEINQLKQTIADHAQQTQRAQQDASAADQKAAASQSEAANAAAKADSVKSDVADLKTATTNTAVGLTEAQKRINKLESPLALHYKGVTLTPGGFAAAETVYRQKATGADIPTPLSSIPFDGANQAQMSEFYGTGRQSRASLMAEGKTKSATYRGYVEVDFLGVGTSSNNNQSNSYVFRDRVFWGEATLHNSGISFQAGQMWSLAAERAKGLSNLSGDVKTPLTIDPNYLPGFVWARQYGFRVTQTLKHVAYGVSVENAQTLTGGTNCPAGSCLLGGGTISGNSAVGVQGSSFNNFSGTYSYNLGPDLIGKVAVDPGWGHYEVFAIGRFPHYERYPNYAATTGSKTAGSYTDSLVTGGFGGSVRMPVFGKYGDLGVSALTGWGVGRYGDTTLADVTFDNNGAMKALSNTSALTSLELHPTKRLTVYANFGEDFVGRLIPAAGGGYAPLTGVNNSGCSVQSSTPTGITQQNNPANCTGANKFVQEIVAGAWYDFYRGPAGRIRYGVQYGNISRAVWGGTTTASAEATENQFYTSFRYYLP